MMNWKRNIVRKSKLLFVLFISGLFAKTVFGQELDDPGSLIRFGSTANATGSGAHAMGMGNAFIGFSDDATAASWNPAGLLQLQNIEVSYALDFFGREGDLDGSRNHPESNSSESTEEFDINFFSVVVPISREGLGPKRIALSLSYLKQFRFEQESNFNASAAQRFEDTGATVTLDFNNDFNQEGTFTTLSPALAFEVTPKISIGLTFNIWNDDVTGASSFDSEERTTGTFAVEIPTPLGVIGDEVTFDTIEKNEFTVNDGYSFTLGGMVILDNQDRWRLGVVYKPGFDLDLDHDQKTIDVINNVIEESTTGEKLTMPSSVGVGLLFNPNESWFFTYDFVWTDWSAHKLREKNGGITVSTNPITGKLLSAGKLEDTYTFRFGSEYRHFLTDPTEGAVQFIPVNFGASIDPVPAVDASDDAYTLSVGSGYVRDNWRFNIAYEYRFGRSLFALETNLLDEGPTVFQEDIDQHRVMASMVYMFR